MVKIINETRLLELSRSLALDQILTSVRTSLRRVNHPNHRIFTGKDLDRGCVVVKFQDTGVSYEVYPKLLDGSEDDSPPPRVSKRPVSVKVNYPGATYNPVDHSFYQGGTLIGPAYVLVNRGYQKEYSGDIKDARLVSSGEVVSPKDFYKKIGSDANPSNRIPSP